MCPCTARAGGKLGISRQQIMCLLSNCHRTSRGPLLKGSWLLQGTISGSTFACGKVLFAMFLLLLLLLQLPMSPVAPRSLLPVIKYKTKMREVRSCLGNHELALDPKPHQTYNYLCRLWRKLGVSQFPTE